MTAMSLAPPALAPLAPAQMTEVAFASIDSPIGTLLAAVTDHGLVRLAFDDEPADEVLGELARQLSAHVREAPARLSAVRHQLHEYFAGHRRRFEIALDWSLVVSPFRRRVLQATAAIPFGQVATYTAIAAQGGNPRAWRAAGSAVGANPIPVVIPCHRVVRTGGGLGGYGGGLHRKAALLELEGVLSTVLG